MGDRRERIGCEGSTGEATTIQLKRRQKRVRVHKYCQLAEFGHRWQRGLIAYLATIGSVQRSSFSCSSTSSCCNQEQVTQRATDRSIHRMRTATHQWGIELHLRASSASTLGGSLIDQTVTIWHLRVQSKLPRSTSSSTSCPLPLRSLIIL